MFSFGLTTGWGQSWARERSCTQLQFSRAQNVALPAFFALEKVQSGSEWKTHHFRKGLSIRNCLLGRRFVVVWF